MDQTLPKLLKRIASEYPDLPGQFAKNSAGRFEPVFFRDYYEIVLSLGAGFISLGHQRGDHIGLIADNRKEWLHSSMAIMAIGGADVPRGCDATKQEISYILSFAECKTAVLENEAQGKKMLEVRGSVPLLDSLIFIDPPSAENSESFSSAGFSVHTYASLLSAGVEWRKLHPGRIEAELEAGLADDIATLIFTSGTTGEPKGVMLTHDNFLCQLEELPSRIILHPGEKALCVLPVWHSFERLCEYVILFSGASIVYSKPIGSILLADLALMNPQLLPSVPRIWESVYDGIFRLMRKTGGIVWLMFNFFVTVAILQSRCERRVFGRSPVVSRASGVAGAVLCFVPFLLLSPLKALGGLLVFKKIRAKLGTGFRGGVSGGGALPPYIDEFFWAVGINVVEGYGLTETAPVVAVRPMSKPVFGTIGTPISCCTVKILDDEGRELPPGSKGTVYVKGRNVMRGYYRKPELTAKVLSSDGWLDTGDIGYKTLKGEIILRGRKKDTIVLRGGENIEPTPIEMKINESCFVSQAVVLGQDQRYLGALIVVNRDELLSWAKEAALPTDRFSDLLSDLQVRKLYESEIADLVNSRNGFKLFERINRFVLLEKQFETGVELSAKQEIMRYKLNDLYKKEIASLFT
ncbi:AMP-binding protein [Treponema zuelzerae]|uniref:AMP-binding protein n=1 Tax=Teretinema zuelzerae TaxID=156 RepID=A0AAE3EJU5_9SPIR|nr:AMP-binding protein [Teretinema zuelzerae]MCD1655822.1 AMP-binding protein [Teretinema zuelzerae]